MDINCSKALLKKDLNLKDQKALKDLKMIKIFNPKYNSQQLLYPNFFQDRKSKYLKMEKLDLLDLNSKNDVITNSNIIKRIIYKYKGTENLIHIPCISKSKEKEFFEDIKDEAYNPLNTLNLTKTNLKKIPLSFITKEKKLIEYIKTQDNFDSNMNQQETYETLNTMDSLETRTSKYANMKLYNSKMDYYKINKELKKKHSIKIKVGEDQSKLNDNDSNENIKNNLTKYYKNNNQDNSNRIESISLQNALEKNKIYFKENSDDNATYNNNNNKFISYIPYAETDNNNYYLKSQQNISYFKEYQTDLRRTLLKLENKKPKDCFSEFVRETQYSKKYPFYAKKNHSSKFLIDLTKSKYIKEISADANNDYNNSSLDKKILEKCETNNCFEKEEIKINDEIFFDENADLEINMKLNKEKKNLEYFIETAKLHKNHKTFLKSFKSINQNSVKTLSKYNFKPSVEKEWKNTTGEINYTYENYKDYLSTKKKFIRKDNQAENDHLKYSNNILSNNFKEGKEKINPESNTISREKNIDDFDDEYRSRNYKESEIILKKTPSLNIHDENFKYRATQYELKSKKKTDNFYNENDTDNIKIKTAESNTIDKKKTKLPALNYINGIEDNKEMLNILKLNTPPSNGIKPFTAEIPMNKNFETELKNKTKMKKIFHDKFTTNDIEFQSKFPSKTKLLLSIPYSSNDFAPFRKFQTTFSNKNPTAIDTNAKIKKNEEMIHFHKKKKLKELKLEISEGFTHMSQLGAKIKTTAEESTSCLRNNIELIQERFYSKYKENWQEKLS